MLSFIFLLQFLGHRVIMSTERFGMNPEVSEQDRFVSICCTERLFWRLQV